MWNIYVFGKKIRRTIYFVFSETSNKYDFHQNSRQFKFKVQGIFKASGLYCPNSRIQGP